MRDSMVNTFQQGMLQRDTSLVMQSWRMSENLLQVDKTHKENIYHHRAVVMAWLGRRNQSGPTGTRRDNDTQRLLLL